LRDKIAQLCRMSDMGLMPKAQPISDRILIQQRAHSPSIHAGIRNLFWKCAPPDNLFRDKFNCWLWERQHLFQYLSK